MGRLTRPLIALQGPKAPLRKVLLPGLKAAATAANSKAHVKDAGKVAPAFRAIAWRARAARAPAECLL